MKVSVILTCAGSGVRAGFGENKLLQKINGQTVFSLSLGVFLRCGLIDEFVITASEKDFSTFKSLSPEGVKIVLGGKTRTDSVKKGLEAVSGDIVLIHDGARPFLTENLVKKVINQTIEHGSAIPILPTPDTVVMQKQGVITNYVGKTELFRVQTPQGFNTNQLKKAYALSGDKVFNDDGEVYLNCYGKLNYVEGEENNTKLTYQKDFEKIKVLNGGRTGCGFDCHRLVEGRKLILGGVEIPHDKGLLGHSDADVLTHAIMDAILSALSLRDIGYHFSDKDPQYKDCCSMKLLNIVLDMVKERGYRICNVSAVIMAEKPKLLTHIPRITKNIAEALGLEKEQVGIGATTLEGLGFVGREEGICVQANALLIKE